MEQIELPVRNWKYWATPCLHTPRSDTSAKLLVQCPAYDTSLILRSSHLPNFLNLRVLKRLIVDPEVSTGKLEYITG